jgi:hypothetical protein
MPRKVKQSRRVGAIPVITDGATKHSMCNTGQRARPEISRQNNSGQTQREAMGKRLREEVSDLILGGSEFWERQF